MAAIEKVPTSDLEAYAAALKASWEQVRRTLIDCALFVERRAREGDAEAQALAEDLAAAQVWMNLETSFAKAALANIERKPKNENDG